MIQSETTTIQYLALHKVGNKAENEGVHLSQLLLDIDEDICQLLFSYFLSPFKNSLYYQLYHDTDLKLNEIYSYVSEIFDNPDMLYEQSVNIAKHLYEQSTHPKVKSGELYIVYFNDCIIDGETADAVGIFKSENKDVFLKVYPSNNGYALESQEGINISKLDKGCIIFNTDKENGYVVSVVDNTSKGSEALYWIDDFLHVRQRNDSYAKTENAIALCKSFINDKIPEEFAVNRAEQADMLSQSAKFFKENDSFDINEFANEVIQQPDIIDSFKAYRNDFAYEQDIELPDSFDISNDAVKRKARVLKSVIKLDKNFHIYVHGNRELIERGIDPETGMQYYRLLFKSEE